LIANPAGFIQPQSTKNTWDHLRGCPTPHRLRNTLVALGQKRCHTPEEFKVWSQDLGHSQMLTTFTNYGNVSAGRQAELMRSMGVDPGDKAEVAEQMAQLAERLRRSDAAT
jgi:hypothetical protein